MKKILLILLFTIGSGFLVADCFAQALQKETTAPAGNPPPGFQFYYTKSGSSFCTKNSSGVEFCTGTGTPSGSAGGDLTGSYPNPTVAKVNGNTPGGTCTNQVVTALSTSAAPTCTTVTSAYVDNSIALTGADINTSNQITATHLVSALPINQGGTGTETGAAQNSVFAGPVSGGSGAPSFQTAPTIAVTNMTGTGGFSTTGNAATATAVNFSGVASSTNTTAAMVVGSGASLAPTGTGTITPTDRIIVDGTQYARSRAGIQAAITAAITASPLGATVFLTAGAYSFGASDACISVTGPVNVIGAGLATEIIVAAGVGATTDVFCITPSAFTEYMTFSNFQIVPASGTPGRYAFNIDTTSGTLVNFSMDHVYAGPLGSFAINESGTNGITVAQIGPSNVFIGGIQMTTAGDTVRIENNYLGGAGSVQLAWLNGSSTLLFKGNNVQLLGGVHIGGYAAIEQIIENEFETPVSFTGSNGAFLDLAGATGALTLQGTIVARNSFQVVNSITTNGIRVDYANNTQIYGNNFERGATTSKDISITSHATSTMIGSNVWASGGPLSSEVADLGTGTSYNFSLPPLISLLLLPNIGGSGAANPYGANAVIWHEFIVPPQGLKLTHIDFYVTTLDSNAGHHYDMCIWDPLTGNLMADTGPLTGAGGAWGSTGTKDIAITQTAVTLPGGTYLFGETGDSATGQFLAQLNNGQSYSMYSNTSGQTTSGGQCTSAGIPIPVTPGFSGGVFADGILAGLH